MFLANANKHTRFAYALRLTVNIHKQHNLQVQDCNSMLSNIHDSNVALHAYVSKLSNTQFSLFETLVHAMLVTHAQLQNELAARS
jgi:hypothetical protein